MSIGTLLLRPQLINQSSGNQRDTDLADMFELFRLLGQLKEGEQAWLAIVIAELENSFEEVRIPVEQNLQRIGVRLRGPLQSFSQQVTGMFGTLADTDSPEKILAKGSDILAELAILLESFNKQQLLNGLEMIFDIIEQDLGFNARQIKEIGQRFFDRLFLRLEADLQPGETAAATHQRQTFARALRKIIKLTEGASELPPFEKRAIIDILDPFIDSLGLEQRLQPIADRIREVAQILAPISAVLNVNAQVNVNATGRSAEHLRLRRLAMDSVTTTIIEEVDQKVCWYASWLNNKEIRSNDPVQRLKDDYINFGEIKAEKMEAIAFHTKWIASWLEVIPHIFSIAFDTRNGFSTSGQPQRTFLSNALNSTWHIINFFLILIDKTYLNRGYHWLAQFASAWLGSYAIPNFRYSDPFGILINLLSVAETQLYARWAFVLREGLLSILTLHNHQAEKLAEFESFLESERNRLDFSPQALARADTLEHIHNQNQVFGFSYLLGEVSVLIFAGIVAATRKDSYGWSDESGTYGLVTDNGWVVGRFFFCALTAILSSILGLFLGAAIAGKLPKSSAWLEMLMKNRMLLPRISTGWDIGLGIIPSLGDDLLRYAVYYFIFQENKTDDGAFLHPSLRAVLGGNFTGYQNRASSPYLLPYAFDRVFQCVQGHLGSFSHTPVSFQFQTYALDFNTDAGDVIIACRSGILWNYNEGTADGTTGRANRAIILHHNPPDPVHDVFLVTLARRTTALYLHGRQNSVTRSITSWLGPNRTIGIRNLSTLTADVTRAFSAVGLNTTTLPGNTPLPVVLDTSGTTPVVVSPVYVLQGQAIIESGDTGRSAYNHLHMEINPSMDPNLGPGTPVGSAGYTEQPLDVPNIAPFSIPFVFHDVDDDGVPKTYIHHQANVQAAIITAVAAPDDPAAAAGATVTITITVTNTGPSNAINILIQNIIPTGYTYNASSIAGGDTNDDTNTPNLIWRINALANGANSSLTFTAQRTSNADITNVTQVIGRESTR
ncbi:MAG: hypothetical protein AAFP19_05460 [Bacteroidota bacterium]